MTVAVKIDANATGLRYAEEESPGVLPGTPTWLGLEPNEYDDFGGSITTIARNPINASRQRKKGVVTDLEAVAGFTQDVTKYNLETLMQGFLFADLRTKDELASTAVTGGNSYTVAAGGDAYDAGTLLYAKGFANPANNGLKTVTVGASGSVTVAESLTNAAGQAGTISRVGVQAADGDISADTSGTFPALDSVLLDFTTLGLIPGEWVYVGGDAAGTAFATAGVNGFARVRSVTANRVEFDKTQGVWADDAGTGKTVRIFVGRVLKNESDQALVKTRTYQFERSLGSPDSTLPGQFQAEYVTGAVASEWELSIGTADKATASFSYQAKDHETRDQSLGLKSGNRPAIVDADAYNTSSDVARIQLGTYDANGKAQVALFTYITEGSLSINNNLNPQKAVGVLGSIDVSAGTFEVGASLTAYFATVAALETVRDNADITLDVHMVKDNGGVSIDLPLCSLGEAMLDVEADEAITLPLDVAAASGAKVDPALDHTMLIVFWDYLPTRAG